MVSLTPEGRAAVETLIPQAQAITEDTLAPLTAKEISTFMKLLAKIA